MEADNTVSEWFYLNAIRMNEEIFSLNAETKDYLKSLLAMDYLLGKYMYIIHGGTKQEATYLINHSIELVYLLKELHHSHGTLFI